MKGIYDLIMPNIKLVNSNNIDVYTILNSLIQPSKQLNTDNYFSIGATHNPINHNQPHIISIRTHYPLPNHNINQMHTVSEKIFKIDGLAIALANSSLTSLNSGLAVSSTDCKIMGGKLT
ncbi:hypothetical protein ACJX0J_036836 [Zea mays]